jgi:hypothetical protein
MDRQIVSQVRRLDAIEQRLDRRIDELEARLYRRIGYFDARVDRIVDHTNISVSEVGGDSARHSH